MVNEKLMNPRGRVKEGTLQESSLCCDMCVCWFGMWGFCSEESSQASGSYHSSFFSPSLCAVMKFQHFEGNMERNSCLIFKIPPKGITALVYIWNTGAFDKAAHATNAPREQYLSYGRVVYLGCNRVSIEQWFPTRRADTPGVSLQLPVSVQRRSLLGLQSKWWWRKKNIKKQAFIHLRSCFTWLWFIGHGINLRMLWVRMRPNVSFWTITG